VARAAAGSPESHGFLIASLIKGRKNARLLTAYGTLYRALDRLERAGMLTSRWEDLSSLGIESRPRRRLYRITEAGAEVLADNPREPDAAPVTLISVKRVPKGATA
jgi:DNA-binding PadR family transcriptional regulator